MNPFRDLSFEKACSDKIVYLKQHIKSLVFLLVICNAVSQMASAQQWYSTNVPRSRHINALKFLSPDDILFGGGNEFNASLQELWISRNKGMEWENVTNIAGQPWIKSMAFLDTIKGFAVGDSATILKTENSARFWTVIPKPIQNRELNKIIYITPQILFIVGGSIPLADTVQTILKSTDGGNTWDIKLDRKGFWLNGISFTDTLIGVAVGDNGTILKTTDGGNTWNTVTAPVMRNFNAVRFINATTGYIVGGSNYPDSKRTILRTTNGGISWAVLNDEAGGILKDITFTGSTIGYIVGDSSILLKTTDGGLNWSEIIVPGASPNQTFNCVEFYNNNLGMIGANDGYLHVYTVSELATAYTLGAGYTDTFNLLFSAGIDTHHEIAAYNFSYSPDSTFSTFNNAFYFPDNIRNNALALINLAVTDSFLLPDTTYYYYVSARTLAGTSYGDTLSFRTVRTAYTFQTLPATNITSSAATLFGQIDKFPSSVNVSFEYGTSPDFGNEITAIPATVSDTFSHPVYANITNLDSNTVYYFRLKGTFNNNTYYGKVQTFFSGTVFKTLQTLSATNIMDSVVTINGFIDKFLLPVTLSFEYGPSTFLGQEVTANPTSVNDSLPHAVTATLANLPPNELFYFRLKGLTSVSPFYGEILVFRSGLSYVYLNTEDATRITNTSAQLNASARHLSSPVILSFEYGLTPALGNSVTASPSTITDTGSYLISANLSGLQQEQIYYFRLKAVSGGITTYGDTRQLYTGASEIPNWDFQHWKRDTVTVPKIWNLIDEDFERVQGHSGNYALKLSKQTFAVIGSIGDGFFGGTSLFLNTIPDSIEAYIRYNVEPGDSAGMMVILKKGGIAISTTICPVTGNSAGTFQRIVTKINYDSFVIPDTVFILTTPTIYLFEKNTIRTNNEITVDDIAFLPEHATFRNSNFEDWFISYVESPVSWFNLRYFGLDTLDPSQNHMVSKVFFEEPEDYAASIRNISWYQNLTVGGELSLRNGLIGGSWGGFPVKGKHTTLNGYYKYIPVWKDSMTILVGMYKGDSLVGSGQIIHWDSVPEFTPFRVPITYTSSSVPDSADIILRSSNSKSPVIGSTLIVDKLSFDGFVLTDITSKITPPELFEEAGIKIYPNPSRDYIVAECDNIKSAYTISIVNIQGQVLKEIRLERNQKYIQIRVGELAVGSYFLLLENEEKIYTKKFIVLK